MSHKAIYKTEFSDVNALHAAMEKLLGKVQKLSDDKLSFKKGVYNYAYADRNADGHFDVTYDSDMGSVFGERYNDKSMCKLKQLYGLYKYQSIYEEMGFRTTVEEQKTPQGLCYVLVGEESGNETEEAIGEVVELV